jgi:hypothetical protein
MSDYIPTTDAGFETFFLNMLHYVQDRTVGANPPWTHIPQAAVTALGDMYNVWNLAYRRTLTPHTPVQTLEKNEARERAKKMIRPFVNQYLRYPPVTDGDRAAMGIPNHDTHPTPGPIPDTIPDIEIKTSIIRELGIRFRALNAKRWGKPKGVHGLECLSVVSDTPPLTIEDLIHSSFATRSPLLLSFDENLRGKRLYFSVRWETGTVKKGPWSEIFNAVIP